MSDSFKLIFNPTLIAGIAAACVGFAAFWANPRRAINRTFFGASLHVAVWLFVLHLSMQTTEGLRWLRLASSIGAFFPLQLWLIGDAILTGDESLLRMLRRRILSILPLTFFATLPLTYWFIPAHSTPEDPVYGWGYYVYGAGVVVAYLIGSYQTVQALRAESGIKRLELQIILIGGSIAAVSVLLLMVMRAVLGLPWLIKLQPFVILTFYAGMVVAITTSRIFDARQILLVALQKFSLVAVVAGMAYGLDSIFGLFLSEPFALLATTAMALWFAATISTWLDRAFQFYPEGSSARQAAFSAAQRESRIDTLEKSFRSVLLGWGQTERALLLSGNKDSISGNGVTLQGEGNVLTALRQLVWVTPERLARERSTAERAALARFLAEHQLGVLVMSNGPAFSMVVGLGVPASRRPYTYPQVTQLLELSSIMENALERAHFSAKAQHTEQLATVGLLGASLAHEIRNPLVSIKTFVQLLPSHHHDPVFREKFFRLIGDEVGRIDQLTEQLLDLASPRTYEATLIELHPLLRSSVDLVAAKAAHRNVQFLTEFHASPDAAYTDASAAKQVMLNLCFNAIQAVEGQAGAQRWVKIVTKNVAQGIEMAVADSGPGIPPEIRPKLFQPFQTTKSTGFGLGLAICSDILSNLHASISVDPPVPGCGATFRVTFPCQPS